MAGGFMNRRCIAISALCIFSSLQVFAAVRIPDNEIREKIIGSWIVPPDSTDYRPQNAYSIETFKADGTYSFVSFRDTACKIVLQQVQVRWTLEGGVLTSILQDGTRSRDEVVDIDGEKMTLHSLDDGTTYTRLRAFTCSKAQRS
jgi:Lipocalin-like domain